jgi:hypothetical protein
MGSNSEDYIFYSCLLDLLIKRLDDATHPNRPHQKKRNDSFRYGGTTLSNIIANDLTHVSVPAEDR